MRNCIIVHGSNSTEEDSKTGKSENLRHWEPWLKRKLEENKIKTSNELYPQDWLPDYNKWKDLFERNEINKNTTLVGHSTGAAFIIRWLVENNVKVDKVILVAPSIVNTDKSKMLSRLKDFEYDSRLKEKFNEIIVFYSDNDDEDIIESAKQVHKRLGGKLIHIKGMDHFCFSDMKTEEFPELFKNIL